MKGRASAKWLTQWEYAHRGLHSPGVPENSLGAARAAMAAGMGIECDIQRSLDGVAMVFHDWELGRLTDGAGLTSVFSAKELEEMRLQESEDHIARLSSFLDQVGGKVPMLIEIKSRPDYDIEKTCEAVSAAFADYSGEHAVMSFDPRVGAWFAENAPETMRGLVCTDTLDMGFLGAWRESGAVEAAQPDFLAVDIRDIPNAFAALWREAGKPLLSWTIRSPDLRELALREVDALISEGEGTG